MNYLSEPEIEHRMERKYVTSLDQERHVEGILALHPGIFKEHYPPRVINSLYFDSPNFHHFMENRDGESLRIKARIRWYGSMFGAVEKPAMELKGKNGGAMWKGRYRLAPFRFEQGFSKTSIDSALQLAQLPDKTMFDLKRLGPTLALQYRRKYYLSSCGRFRITIDSQMLYVGVNQLTNSFLGIEHDRESLVIELKYGIDDEEDAVQVANGIPFRLSRNSKYVNGIAKVYVF